MKIPDDVKKVIDILESCGFKTYAVGGCVRDALMGREVHDWDVATSARVNEVKSCLGQFKVIETGVKHGTVTVISGGQKIEVTTFRVDGAYSDGRHPDSVKFTDSLELDLGRRDFTVNAMAFSHDGGIIDLFGGRSDLESGVIRCVGSPDVRFQEDALRIIRALRFSSVLCFELEKNTSEAVMSNSGLLKMIARERIWEELKKLLCGANVYDVLIRYGEVFVEVIPQLRPLIDSARNSPSCTWERTVRAVEFTKPDPVLRFAVLMCGVERSLSCDKKDDLSIDGAVRSLKMSGEERNRIVTLVRNSGVCVVPDRQNIKRRLRDLGERAFKDLLSVKVSELQADGKNVEALKDLHRAEEITEEILAGKECFCLKHLAVNGHDMMSHGVDSGKRIGELLMMLLEAVIDGECANEREALLRFLSERLL